MTTPSLPALESAIQNLQARRPKPRGRRQELAPYADQLRALIAAGWTRAEIVAEIRALGGKMSPALLRDVLQIGPAKPQRSSRLKAINRQDLASPRPPAVQTSAASLPPAAPPFEDDQPTALESAPYDGQLTDDAE